MKESIIFREENFTEKVHYVYRVTIDEHYYIGKRTGFLNDLKTGRYKTSSNIIKEKLRNGSHFSKIKILQVFSTKEEALGFEERILTRLNAKINPKFLNQSNGNKDFYVEKHTEETKAKMSKSHKELYKTEQGSKNKENHSEFMKERFNPETEQGRKNLEENRRRGVERFNSNTEEGRKRREKQSQSAKAKFDINTEQGRKRRENNSEKMKEYYNPETEEGRRNKEKQSQLAKVTSQKRTETNLQKRQNASILGELMFNEAFIRENFLIRDDKNNLRFLSSVYSKLSTYSRSHICLEKRIGKLSFLYGINSISLSEEQENTKIKEIEAIIKSRNEELSLKAS